MQHYGIGFVAAIPVGVANPTPVPFGLVKGVSFDVSVKMTKERGQWRDPVVVGYGERDITGKIEGISIFGAAVGQVLGVTPAAGSKLGVPGEVWTLAAGAYTVANGANFAVDYGVLDLTSGKYLTAVASAPASGQYVAGAVGVGTYTFAAADNGHKMSVAYSYTAASAGKTSALVNTPMSIATGFVLAAYGPTVNGTVFGVKFYNAFLPKLSFALKPSDFTMQNVEFFAAQDSASTSTMDVYTGE